MTIFSEGGTSYPDILVVCYLSTCFLISTILNPAVFLYNYRKKKNSVPIFLFKCLSVFDFITGVVIPIKVIIEAVKPECVVKEDSITYNQNISCIERIGLWLETDIKYIPLRIYSLIQWVVTFMPNVIAAVMAICRFIQIRFPFFHLKIKHILPLALVFGLYTLGLCGYVAFDKHGAYTPGTQVFTHSLNLTNGFLMVSIYAWPSILCQVASVVTSLLTIQHLCNIRKNLVSAQSRSSKVSTKSSVKILITNFGSIFNNLVMGTCIMMSAIKANRRRSVSLFISSVLAPVLLSCFNPIVFIIFTPNFSLKRKPRPSQSSSVVRSKKEG